MLSDLVPTLTEAERVRRALNARSMQPLLSELTGSRARCHVLDAKYAAGSGCTVLYRIGDRLVTADLDLDPAAPAADRFGPRLSVFPGDPALPGLPVVADQGARLAALLAPALSDAGEGHLLSCRTSLLRYRPRRRATFLVNAWVRRGGGLRPVRYVAKVYHDGAKAAAVHAETVRLANALAQRDGVLSVAQPVAHVPALRLVLQRPVDGTPLEGMLAGVGRSLQPRVSVRRAAAALAVLHAQIPVSERRRPVHAELRRFAVRADALAAVDPRLAERLHAAAATLTQRAARLPAPRAGLVHGDCKPSQFRLAPQAPQAPQPAVALLDFDHCGLADPLSDVGTFLASLRKLAAQSPARAGALDDLGQAFVTAYAAASSDPLAAEPEIVHWHEAVALVRKALRAFARAPRSPLATSLTECATVCLTRPGGMR